MRGLDAGDQDVRLTDEQGNPLFLFLLDGRPATINGVPLLNIVGNSLVSYSFVTGPNGYHDWKGYPLTDSRGRTRKHSGYSPTEPLPVPAPKHKIDFQVFSMDGIPLTDPDGVPLLNVHGEMMIVFDPKGHPVMDFEGNEVTDEHGIILYYNDRPFLSKDNAPLRVYDELGRPLTDENGFPFTNILGSQLFLTDNNRIPTKTLRGYDIKDAEGNAQWEEGFDLTKVPKYYKMNKAIICKLNAHGIAFDRNGFPLTDMNGFPLFDANGHLLVKKKKVWIDVNAFPVTVIHKSVYDRGELFQLRNSRGTPVSLYDKRGYPLTDHEGTPLIHASGLILIRFNEVGEPESDINGDPLFDEMGNPLGSKLFSPCKKTLHMEFLTNIKGCGVQFFEATGMPVTNKNGIPLLNNYNELIAVFNSKGVPIEDAKGRDVYDILGLPIVTTFNKPLLDPTGYPIRLYDKLGKPLTDKSGNILKTISGDNVLKINVLGQIVSDAKGGTLYDFEGNSMNNIDKFLSNKKRKERNCKVLLNCDGSPLLMYDVNGAPLTDSKGRVLMDSSGKNLVISSASGIITEKNGNPAYDLDGYTSVRVAGRTVGMKIAVYDSHDLPLLGTAGFILKLRTGREILRMDKAGFPVSTYNGQTIFDHKGHPIFTPLSDISEIPSYEKKIIFGGKIQIFSCDDWPLLDLTGELLYTSRGVPLIQFDRSNKPRTDYIGRPLYDVRGIPISNPGGVWKDQRGVPYRLFDKDGLPLTDQRGKELVDINGMPLIKRGDYGHPKYDRYGNLVTDANRHKITDMKFLGTLVPRESNISPLMVSPNKPLRLYDLDKRPLTDECGKPLQSLKGTPVLDLRFGLNKIVDFLGRSVYDSRKIPLACDPTTPIISMKGKPMALYNMDGNPLTSMDGVALTGSDGTPLLSFDEFGRPWKAGKSGLYDAYGVSVDSPACHLEGVLAHQIPSLSLTGRPFHSFSNRNRPTPDCKDNFRARPEVKPHRSGSRGDSLG